MYDLLKSSLPLPFKIAAYAILILAIYLIYKIDTIVQGLFLVIFSVVSLSLKNGILFNFEERTYLKYTKIIGFTLGKWEKLNEIRYISIVPVILKQRYNFLSIGMDTQDKQCKINFIYTHNKYDSILRNKYADLLPIAKDLAKGLNVDILDVSSGKKQWLNETEVIIS